MSKTNQNHHRCDFKPAGERVCGKPATWVALDHNEMVAVACDPHSDELAGDACLNVETISWFKMIGKTN